MPWLTGLTLVCLGILISLGTWQYRRLQWKTDLIVEIDAAAEASPITNLAVANQLFKADDPLDFRRISLAGEFIAPSANVGQPFHLVMPDGKSLEWRLIQPFKTDNGNVYVASTTFENARKNSPPEAETGPHTIRGYARLVRKSSRFAPKSNPATNSWYVFNGNPDVLDWEAAVDGSKIPTGYYIDWVMSTGSAAELPVKKPEIRNHHLDYMLTWYSFALILLVIYLLLHKRQGRLQFGN
jgi:surfeit locus 1 family protein